MAVRQGNAEPVVASAGELTNPTTSTDLADTGAMPGGIYEVTAIASCTVAGEILVTRRNAADSADVGTGVIWYIAAGVPYGFPLKFALEPNERIVMRPNANITGVAVGNLIAQRIS